MKICSRRDLVLGTWNVRTLVESSGDLRVCRKRQMGAEPNVVDRKLDLLVKETERYGVSVAGIQETKWFGNDVWHATGGYTFLHSGRPLPASGDAAVRNEGVGILLNERAAAAWRQAGEAWEAVSSRIVMARLKWVGRGQSRGGGSRETSNVFVTVVCVYAPTARAPPGVKEKFSCELQDTLDKVPRNDVLVLLGDFNARVGVLKSDEEEWQGVVGRNGLDERNEAGEDLMQFCALNQLTVMNTWFQKKLVQYGTWTHPATKVSHMIDLVVMRAGQRMCCRDVQVMRGANCWTDHNLVRAKLRLKLPCVQGRREKKVLPFSVHKFVVPTARDEYRSQLESTLEDHPYRPDQSPERRLTSFYNRCVRTILGVTRFQQWKERLTSKTLLGRFGMSWSIPDFIMDRRLQWLGHVGRMSEERLPKMMLFGELRKKRPCHGTKKRWRDQMSGDLQAICMKEDWYQLCQDRKEWYGKCRTGVDEVASCKRRNTCAANCQDQGRSFVCQCGRTFRRQGDLTRHRKFCRWGN